MVHIVLLSGGSGTRLWPLSNESRSKQFLKVLRDEKGNHVSMVQRVFAQIGRAPLEADVTIATCASQENSIRSQVEGEYALVLEPERRDTAPAIMLACASLAMRQGAHAEETVVVMPIDTYADQEYYDRIVLLDEAVQFGAAELVLLGVEPTHPTEKYGYILPASREGMPWPVERFTEKPSVEIAKELVANGALWNCGVFAFKLGYLMEIIRKCVETDSFDELRSRYEELPKISFDFAVVERAESVAVVPYAGTWKDLGTWNTLTDEMDDAYSGRAIVDESTCADIHVINETGIPLVVAGLSNSVVVATPDGILVSGKEASTNIKLQVAKAAESRPMYEKRRWGEYRVIDNSSFPENRKALTKELVVKNGKQLSYQRHMRRSEVWTVVSGRGEAVLNGEVRELAPGSVVNVEKETMHAMRALSSDLHVIEVQLGDVLVEEDIERFGNWWS